jgi:hypothetical protein
MASQWVGNCSNISFLRRELIVIFKVRIQTTNGAVRRDNCFAKNAELENSIHASFQLKVERKISEKVEAHSTDL